MYKFLLFRVPTLSSLSWPLAAASFVILFLLGASACAGAPPSSVLLGSHLIFVIIRGRVVLRDLKRNENARNMTVTTTN